MQLFGQFLKLIRWPNLVFIIITQVLFHFCVIMPSANSEHFSFPIQLNQLMFWMLVLASVCIAGAGYIINDYFDINIDQVNKPEKVIVNKVISRRVAIFWHWLLSAIGLLLTGWISHRLGNYILLLGNLICVAMLWVYSTTYKRRLLIGNVLISLMTAWVILVLLIAELPGWWNGELKHVIEKYTAARLIRIGLLYASFAFLISLVREVVKDMEDMEGDRLEHCKTMPLVFGVNAAKIFAANWLVMLIALLAITQIYVLQFGWWWSAVYIFAVVLIPLFYIFKSLLAAQSSQEFGRVSRHIKWTMLMGILSMVFFLWYS